jgi:hypothetical protein
MMNVVASTANVSKREQADRIWRQLLEESLRRGFFGTAGIEISVQDGIIQLIRRRLEQMEK